MDQETIVYMGLTCLVAVMIFFGNGNYGPLSIVAVAISLLTIGMILLINFADFLVFPLVTTALKVKIIPAKGFIIPESQSCIIKEVNGIYYATGYLTANIYNYVFSAERADVDTESSLVAAPAKWESIVTNAKFPFKFNIVSASEDIQVYREELEAKRAAMEFQLSRETSSSNPNQMSIDDFNRRINIIQARIDRLSQGEKPVNTLMYIESLGFGVTEKEAKDNLEAQINQLTTMFNTFDLSISRVVGREAYILFKFNYFIPPTVADISQIFNQQT